MPCLTRFLETRIERLEHSDAYNLRQLEHCDSEVLKDLIEGRNAKSHIGFTKALLAKHNGEDPMPHLHDALKAFTAMTTYYAHKEGNMEPPTATTIRDFLVLCIDDWRLPERPTPLGRFLSEEQVVDSHWEVAHLKTLYGLLNNDMESVERNLDKALELSQEMAAFPPNPEAGHYRYA